MHSIPIYVAVVDDDEDLRRSLARLLRAAGFQAMTYLSAEASRAAAYLRKTDSAADVLATAASSVKPAVIPVQSPQAFTLAVPLSVEIMNSVAVS